MKKIFFFLLFILPLFASASLLPIPVTSSKWSVDSFSVGRDRVARVYLVNEIGQTMIKNVRAVVNPKYNQYGQLVDGSTDNRGGLMLTPPIRPGVWEKDGSGNIVPVNFSHNSGCGTSTALVYIIEGYWSLDGKSITYTGREETVEFGTFNPMDWVRQYQVGSYEIPNFCLPVQVTKDYSSARYFGK